MHDEYRALPMVMPPEEIARKAEEAIRRARAEPGLSVDDVIYALIELRKRQQYYWRPLPPEVLSQVDEWLVEAWEANPDLDLESWVDAMDVGDGTERNPGTHRAMRLLRKIAETDERPAVRQIAAQCIRDIEDEIRGCELQDGRTWPSVYTGRSDEGDET